jgi:hypothetical protein
LYRSAMTERREWLIRCEFERDEMAVCSVEASAGKVGIVHPDHSAIYLTPDQSYEFTDALRSATTQVERDNRETRVRPERSARPSGTP